MIRNHLSTRGKSGSGRNYPSAFHPEMSEIKEQLLRDYMVQTVRLCSSSAEDSGISNQRPHLVWSL